MSKDLSLVACLIILSVILSAIGADGSAGKSKLLILDLDGTLYDNDCKIEDHIRDGYHRYAQQYSYSPEKCEDLHKKYGAGIIGLMIENNEPQENIADYYTEAYPYIDMSRLLKYHSKSYSPSGYTSLHSNALQALHKLKPATKSKLLLASNSPIFHVRRAITRLGINNVPFDGFYTPERINGVLKNDDRFWNPLLATYPSDKYDLTLVDDNGLNLKIVGKLGIKGIHISSKLSFSEALLMFLEVLPPRPLQSTAAGTSHGLKADKADDIMRGLDVEFREDLYLQAKAQVERETTSAAVLSQLEQELLLRRASIPPVDAETAEDVATEDAKKKKKKKEEEGAGQEMCVVDLGAGSLSMLEPMLALISRTQKIMGVSRVKYVAIDRAFTPVLLSVCEDLLSRLGLSRTQLVEGDALEYSGVVGDLEITVMLLPVDFLDMKSKPLLDKCIGMGSKRKVDLVVGNSLVDLLDPRQLGAALVELCGDLGGVLYFPSTFAGKTSIETTPSVSDSPQTVDPSSIGSPEPALSAVECAEVMDCYHKHLESLGHHLSVPRLIQTLKGFGLELCPSGCVSSSWRVSRDRHPYMWFSMYRFIALGTVFHLLGDNKVDILGWLKTVRRESGDWCVENCDLLFTLPALNQVVTKEEILRNWSPTEFIEPSASFQMEANDDMFLQRDLIYQRGERFVQFDAPGVLSVVESEVTRPSSNQLLVQTTCSLISPGTELKVFRGEFESGQPTDLTIGGMEEEMKFPLRYGYSLVGRVVDLGDSVSSDWLGKRVFAFSPHSSAAVVDTSAVHIIPDDVSAEDAVFAPSVETAVSLTQDAKPVLGERIAVIGQGLIGILTAAVLTGMGMDVTAVDISQSRLARTKAFNPSVSVWNPSESSISSKEFDMCIEVSGSEQGLQLALDNTGYGGRIIVGSWYRSSSSSSSLMKPLRLGSTKLHRSHISVYFSQVSSISAGLSERWTKKRRFETMWKVLARLKPSLLLEGKRRALSTAEVMKAFSELEKGDIVTALLDPCVFLE